jgi:hypothetical protein
MSQTATAIKTAETPQPIKTPRTIMPSDLVEADFAYARFSYTMAPDVSFQDILEPEFWRNVARLFMADPANGRLEASGSIIEVRSCDKSLYAELYVKRAHQYSLEVEVIAKHQFGPDDKTFTEAAFAKGFRVNWNAQQHGYDLIRISDRQQINKASDFRSREDVMRWLAEAPKR